MVETKKGKKKSSYEAIRYFVKELVSHVGVMEQQFEDRIGKLEAKLTAHLFVSKEASNLKKRTTKSENPTNGLVGRVSLLERGACVLLADINEVKTNYDDRMGYIDRQWVEDVNARLLWAENVVNQIDCLEDVLRMKVSDLNDDIDNTNRRLMVVEKRKSFFSKWTWGKKRGKKK